jgi:parvulin-like peptidyl-prolyl isomerase
MVPEFEQVIAALQPNERSGIFFTPFGFHIALLHSHETNKVADLSEVRIDIQRVLTFASKHKLYMRKMAEFRSTADIRRVGDAA